MCFLELLVVGPEQDRDAINSGFWYIVDTNTESSAYEGEVAVAIDGR